MLTNTFIHLPGVGAPTERSLWHQGCEDWDCYLAGGRNYSVGSASKEAFRRELARSKENLAIGVDGDNLTIEGTVALGESQRMQPVYAEVRVGRYKRTFVLSRDLDATKIDAAIRDGVLTLTVPKSEQAKPRRIAVRAG